MTPRTIVFAGGASGGHSSVAVRLATAAQRLGLHAVLATRDVDRKYAGPWMGPVFTIPDPPRPRGPRWAFRAAMDIAEAWHALRPHSLVTVGGYVSVPTTLLASISGVPHAFHEANFHNGRANRLASLSARGRLISWGDDAEGVPVADIEYRPAHVARRELRLDSALPVILIVGGSQGSKEINAAAESLLRDLRSGAYGVAVGQVSVVWVDGGKMDRDPWLGHPGLRMVDFLPGLDLALDAASVVICRAGAVTLSEIVLRRRPALIIPLETADRHQVANARAVAQHPGMHFVPGKEALMPGVLSSNVREMLFRYPDAVWPGTCPLMIDPGARRCTARLAELLRW